MMPNIPSEYGAGDIGLLLSLTSCCMERPSILEEDRTSLDNVSQNTRPTARVSVRGPPPSTASIHKRPLTEHSGRREHGQDVHRRQQAVRRLRRCVRLGLHLLHVSLRVEAGPAALPAHTNTHQHAAMQCTTAQRIARSAQHTSAAAGLNASTGDSTGVAAAPRASRTLRWVTALHCGTLSRRDPINEDTAIAQCVPCWAGISLSMTETFAPSRCGKPLVDVIVSLSILAEATFCGRGTFWRWLAT